MKLPLSQNKQPALMALLLLMLLLHTAAPAAGQALPWQSVQGLIPATPNADNDSNISQVVPDGAGNLYVVGSFVGNITLGSLVLRGSGTNRGGFVGKWQPASGTYAWAVPTSGSLFLALAVSGNALYLTGTLTTGTAQIGGITLSSGTVFVAKLVDAGPSASVAWAVAGGAAPNLSDGPLCLTVRGSSVYVGGSFISPALTFGPTTITNSAASRPNAFLVKVTDAGTSASFAWAASFGGVGGTAVVSGLATNGTDVYLCGYTSGAVAPIFGSPAPLVPGLLVARLTDTGTGPALGWLAQTTNPNPIQALAVQFPRLAVSGAQLFVSGTKTGVGGFGSTVLGLPGSVGYNQVFVTRLTDTGTAGTFDWAVQLGHPRGNVSNGQLAVSGNALYLVGAFASPMLTIGTTTLFNSAAVVNIYSDGFVARLSDVGSGSPAWAWASSAQSFARNNIFQSVATSGGQVYAAGGIYATSVTFAPLTLANPNANNLFAAVGFVASLRDPLVTATRPALAPPPADLFLNPAHGTATLRLPAGATRQPLNLLDALGREARRYPAPNAPETLLDLRGLPAGLYLLRGAGPGSQRLVVE